jgi:hypothetical protein
MCVSNEDCRPLESIAETQPNSIRRAEVLRDDLRRAAVRVPDAVTTVAVGDR